MKKTFKTVTMFLLVGMFAVPTSGSAQNNPINKYTKALSHNHYVKIHTTIGTNYAPAALEGCFCTTASKDFAGLRYDPLVPYCKRHVTMHEKNEIAGAYNISPQQYKHYEFDHFIPLSIGGSNNPCNIWPQPTLQAKIKDKLELELYYAVKAGKITRHQAAKIISSWFHHPCTGLDNHNLCR